MSELFRAEGLALVRGGRLLFEGLDLSVAPGERLHLTGPNGSGKSSLIRLIAGLLQPNAGTVERVDVALADDKLALDRELPLRRALCFWIGPNRATERLDDALTTLNLADLASVLVRLLSTGQLKRAALARVAASTARLWLLDEPANGLDAASFDAFALLMEAHTADGGAIIAASHVPLPGTWRTLELGR